MIGKAIFYIIIQKANMIYLADTSQEQSPCIHIGWPISALLSERAKKHAVADWLARGSAP